MPSGNGARIVPTSRRICDRGEYAWLDLLFLLAVPRLPPIKGLPHDLPDRIPRMNEFFDHPAFQGGVAPFVVALIVAFALGRTRFVWLAIMPAYATMVALDTGFTLFPPTVARKTWVIALLVPLAGVAADRYRRSSRQLVLALAIAAGLPVALGLSFRSPEPRRCHGRRRRRGHRGLRRGDGRGRAPPA